MSAPASTAPGGRALTIRGTAYPVLLPKLRDPRLHLAAVIISLQVLGQVAFDFRVSIAQILISIGTCAVLEFAIAFRSKHVLMWPASAMLTGNGVAFVLRVPGTEHGDWWSLHGWWIFVGTAAVSLLSKYVIKVARLAHLQPVEHRARPLLPRSSARSRAEPLDFWWGPMSAWMALALAIIVVGGLAILTRLHLLVVARRLLALVRRRHRRCSRSTGHAMTARWHLGPITGAYFWWVLVTSPEILVFLFFMITDPKTTPTATRARVIYAVSVGLLAALLIAPATTEFWSKVARARRARDRLRGAAAARAPARDPVEPAAARRAVAASSWSATPARSRRRASAARPETTVAPLAHTGPAAAARDPALEGRRDACSTGRRRAASPATSSRTSASRRPRCRTARARALARATIGDELTALTRQVRRAAGGTIDVPASRLDQMRVWLEPGHGQGPAIAVATLQGTRQLTAYKDVPPTMVRRDPAVAFRETLELQEDRAAGSSRTCAAAVRSRSSPRRRRAPATRQAAAAGFAGVRLDGRREPGRPRLPAGRLPLRRHRRHRRR